LPAKTSSRKTFFIELFDMNSKNTRRKISKEERRAKYTLIAKERRMKQASRERKRALVCYKCRGMGHSASECSSSTVVCYKCGSKDHSWKDCSKFERGDLDLPYATCYICEKEGHIASSCPENSRGIYVNGGACRKCGSKQHISAKCPDSQAVKTLKSELPAVIYDDLLDETSDLIGAESKQNLKMVKSTKKRCKIVTF
jgi:zinc finger CCHC domain-containing protein 9